MSFCTPRWNRQSAQRLNICVAWLGGERVALRAIALRDGDGQRLSGRDATSRTFRAGLFDDIRRFLYGPSLNPDSLRRNIIGIYSGEEPYPQEVTGYALFDRMLRDTFNVVNSTNANLRDSLPLFSAQSGVI
ncbi:MAG: hypothetical protein IT211_09110 [Armatimonadetes bacterium]|nr:hypothetical protein [Armatimonadota bacterium]